MNKGDKVNFLTMISDVLPASKKNYPKAMFRCDCGNIKEIGIKNVERGSTKSCGCVSSLLQNNARHRYEHGFYGTRIYNIYHKMKTRCYNSSYSESRYYKDRM